MTKTGLIGLIDNLQGTVKSLSWAPKGTEWGDYYDSTNYSRQAFDHKSQLIQEFVARVQPHTAADLGSNTGVFSRLAASNGAMVVSADIDPAAVEKNYRDMREKKEQNLLPLVLDLTNPSAGIGWANAERDSFASRGPFDMVMALALVHHLAISNNVPLPEVAAFLRSLGQWLVVEFIPKEDSQVRRLLSSRKDIFPSYHQQGFEEAFTSCFVIRETHPIKDSQRVLYLMEAF
jgi:ribosomal protein L11 methylase PrmA